MHDILRESPIYQLILQEDLQEGCQEGFQAGLQALRQAIADIVQLRFPDLVGFTEQTMAKISDLDRLRRLNVEMVTAQSAEHNCHPLKNG